MCFFETGADLIPVFLDPFTMVMLGIFAITFAISECGMALLFFSGLWRKFVLGNLTSDLVSFVITRFLALSLSIFTASSVISFLMID